MKVCMEFMRPAELEQALARCPTLLQPLGTIEWHGRHNVVGVDAVKAHALCVRAAEKAGCVVAPPLYGGIGGLEEPFTFIIDPDDGFDSKVVRGWLEKLCIEAKRQGYKAMIVLTGHYGAGQQIVVRETAVRMSRLLNMPILGTPEYFLALDAGYTGDHAAFFETSLMMYLYPDTVKLDELKDGEKHQGVHGKDPKQYATAQDGERFAAPIIERVAKLAQAMPTWTQETLDRFIRAEAAIVNRQIALYAQHGHVWAGWRRVATEAIAAYPGLLANERFEEIVQLAGQM